MITHPELPKSRTLSNLLKGISHELLVRYSLYCAKDCFRYNDDETRPYAQKCIDLTEDWLKTREESQELMIACAVAENQGMISSYPAYYALKSCSSAIRVIYDDDIVDFASSAAYNAHCTCWRKLSVFKRIAMFMHSRSDISEPHRSTINNLIEEQDLKMKLRLIMDYLEEQGRYDLTINRREGMKLNVRNNLIYVFGANRDCLIDQLSRRPWVDLYLRALFQ